MIDKEADVAGDGTPNLLKYAFGLDPRASLNPETRAALPKLNNEEGVKAYVFELPLQVLGDFVIRVEASSDLSTWQEIARRTRGGSWTGTASVFTGTPDISGLRAQTFITEPPLPVFEVRFYRMKIDFAP